MNDELDMELEIVELGDAKEETKGAFSGVLIEDSPNSPKKQPG